MLFKFAETETSSQLSLMLSFLGSVDLLRHRKLHKLWQHIFLSFTFLSTLLNASDLHLFLFAMSPPCLFELKQAIICGKVGQAPVQKILRNGRTITIFTVGTGGMFDQRIVGATGLPKPVQWHRIAVHNEILGTYAVQKFVKKYVSIF